ncbi:MAG TPA: hypothetical protein VLG40_01830 [Candidatus Saccharimonas sp.]|nr:hypothetical protein [Candidatus Saccharimonas sp.]
MRDLLPYISAVLTFVAVAPYLRDTIKGKTRPNIVTWSTWTLLTVINTVIAVNAGAWQTAIFSIGATLATGSIMIVGFTRGIKKYTMFDIVCQLFALCGIPLWLLTGQPALAVFILMCVDFAGGLPTLRHAWRSPGEETWQTFAISAFAGSLTVVSLSQYNFVSLAMPLYITLFDAVMLYIVLYRRRVS